MLKLVAEPKESIQFCFLANFKFLLILYEIFRVERLYKMIVTLLLRVSFKKKKTSLKIILQIFMEWSIILVILTEVAKADRQIYRQISGIK